MLELREKEIINLNHYLRMLLKREEQVDFLMATLTNEGLLIRV
jgi:hypothetical protein